MDLECSWIRIWDDRRNCDDCLGFNRRLNFFGVEICGCRGFSCGEHYVFGSESSDFTSLKKLFFPGIIFAREKLDEFEIQGTSL